MGIIFVAARSDEIDEQRLAGLRERSGGREVVIGSSEADLESRIDDIEILFGGFGGPGRELLKRAKNLTWYQQSGAGADWLMKSPEIDLGSLIITNASGVHAVNITEHILAYMLCFARGFRACIVGQTNHVWKANREQHIFELAGARVVLLGIGAIGARFAATARALGMEVIGVARTVPPASGPAADVSESGSSGAAPARSTEGMARVIAVADLDRELPGADFVVVTAPLTTETFHLFDARRLALMKRGSYIVNIGRGAIIDESALIDALEREHLGGAGLDVFETEPLPTDSPLWRLQNVILTPHYAGATPRYQERLWEIFLDNLDRYNRGAPLRNVVDVARGY